MAITASLKIVIDGALTAIGATDKLYFQNAGAFAYGATGAITVNNYNDGFHIINSSNEDVCVTTHATNLKYLTDATVSVNGGPSINVSAISANQCLLFNIISDTAIEVPSATFFVHGASESSAPTGITVKGFEQGNSQWYNVGGSSNARSLWGEASTSTDHQYYIALSVMPTTNGALTGTLKCSATCV